MITKDLRKLIVSQLTPIIPRVYYNRAPQATAFPYAVFSLSRFDLSDLSRDDIVLDIEIYDRSSDPLTIEDIADRIESHLNAANLPQETILPTIYRNARTMVREDDIQIQHLHIDFMIQEYDNL